jgi:hypothetical protein
MAREARLVYKPGFAISLVGLSWSTLAASHGSTIDLSFSSTLYHKVSANGYLHDYLV